MKIFLFCLDKVNIIVSCFPPLMDYFQTKIIKIFGIVNVVDYLFVDLWTGQSKIG